jgi:hypothetical protein
MKMSGMVGLVAMLNLPNSLAQDWTSNSASNLSWISVDSSADGKRLITAALTGPIFTSTNSGATWEASVSPGDGWGSVASSADGLVLAACRYTSPTLGYLSTNGGETWNYIGRSGSHIDVSADGRFLAIANPSLISVSTNRGVNWRLTSAPSKSWSCLASSATGAALVAAASNEGIYTSSDFGETWTSNAVPHRSWSSASLSADGRVAVVVSGRKNGPIGPIFVSTNFFESWFPASAPVTNWVSVAMSSDASRMFALTAVSSPTGRNSVFMSTNCGANWFEISSPNAWWSDIATSADAGKAVAVASLTNAIFTLKLFSPPILTITKGDALQLSWLTPSSEYELQRADELVNDNWTKLAVSPTLDLTNLLQQVSIPATNSKAYFRLKSL